MARESTSNITTVNNVEIEASSYSVWNCVITILLISTMLYGAGWTHVSSYNLTPENVFPYQNFKAIAFFFSVWALQSIALALLLIWAVGKKSYSLCHSWLLSEAMMQVFIIVTTIYFAYRAILPTTVISSQSATDSGPSYQTTSTSGSVHHYDFAFRPPKHLTFLTILHFLIKGFGFYVIGKFMKKLKATSSDVENNVTEIAADEETQETHDISSGRSRSAQRRPRSRSRNRRQVSPPPSYAVLCKDDLPCYDEALKLCLNDSSFAMTEGLATATTAAANEEDRDRDEDDANSATSLSQDDATKDQSKTPLVITT